jgi:hypothetical protein
MEICYDIIKEKKEKNSKRELQLNNYYPIKVFLLKLQPIKSVYTWRVVPFSFWYSMIATTVVVLQYVVWHVGFLFCPYITPIKSAIFIAICIKIMPSPTLIWKFVLKLSPFLYIYCILLVCLLPILSLHQSEKKPKTLTYIRTSSISLNLVEKINNRPIFLKLVSNLYIYV